MQLFLVFARAYPRRNLLMLVCLSLAAVAEGVGLSSLLPLLSLATNSAATVGERSPGAVEQGNVWLGQLIENALGRLGLQPSIGLLLTIIVAGVILKAGLVLFAQKQVGYTVAQVATDLRFALIRALLAARWPYYIRQPVGGITNAFATEATRAADAYLHGATMVTQFIEVALYTSLAVVVSWQATLAAIATGLFVVYALNHLVRMARRAGLRHTRLLRAVLGRLTDVLYTVKPLKAMAREPLVQPLLEGETQRLNRSLQRQVLSKEALRALQEPLLVAVLAAGLYLALTRWALPLDTVLLLTLLFARTLNSLHKVQRQYQAMVTCESAYWSLRNTIAHAESEREVTAGTEKPQLQAAILLERVSLSYGSHPVLREVSLRIPAGQVTALIGPSGAGKTSILDLIVGLVQPAAGAVWIDDTPLGEVNLRSWRQTIGYVPQETFLLHESVYTNVSLGDPALSPTEVETALRAAGAWDFVATMPQGMFTPVGEHGAAISGGQRQRIAIARALVHDPQLLILDEATASLDPKSEAEIYTTIRQLRGRMTIIAVSHQPALLEAADKVYRLEGGAVKELELLPAGHPGAPAEKTLTVRA